VVWKITHSFEGGGWVCNFLNTECMVFIIGVVFLILLALFMGFRGCHQVDVGLELNTFQSPFYKIGISSDRHSLDDGSIEDEVIVGLFFVNIVFVFWKPND
jgi:hypothetical protein